MLYKIFNSDFDSEDAYLTAMRDFQAGFPGMEVRILWVGPDSFGRRSRYDPTARTASLAPAMAAP